MKCRPVFPNVLLIQITILGWLVEWAGFAVLAVGSYLLGNKNNTVTMTLQSITMLFYVVFLPCSNIWSTSNRRLALHRIGALPECRAE